MTSTRARTNRPPLAPLDPSTLRPQAPFIKCSPTTVPINSVVECFLSPDSPLDGHSRRVHTPIYRTPLTHHRALRRPTQCRSAEQDDIDEIMRFLKRVSRCMMHVYQVISAVATSVFHATIATVQWLAVVAFVIEVIMLTSSPSVRGDHGGGFIRPIVEQFTSTATAINNAKTTTIPYSRTTEAVALSFLSEQIDQAHNLLTLVEGLGDDAFFAYHHTNVQHFLSRFRGDSPGGSKTEVKLTVDFRGLDSTLIQTLSPHGFIGRTISHALDEVTYHSKRSQTAFLIRRGAVRESRLDSVFLLAASNLLLEYSSILSKTDSIIPDLEALHLQLSRNLPEEVWARMQSREVAAPKRSIWGVFAGRRLDPKAVEEESVQVFVASLEAVIANLRQLKAYLEWITNQLSQRTLLSSASMVSSPSDHSCSSALRDLLDRASAASKKWNRCCRCPDSKDSATAPARVEFNIPGSRTLQTAS
ncbi:hypothetical protein DFH29DRAFT_425051 [Suillus ampliporus]|nr:hypothetical protein DFH29DRAFT_425051 [Suillus ampliporus]